MIITKYLQNTFVFETSGRKVLIDPGKFNPQRGFNAEVFGKLDGIIITHKHADHYDLNFLKELYDISTPQILTNPEIASLLGKEGLGCYQAKAGDIKEFCGFNLRLTQTDHLVNGEFLINFGVIISDSKYSVFHTSDTRYIDPKSFNEPKLNNLDVLLVPISNRGLVMGIDDALYFTNTINPKVVIPMHYNSPKDEPRIKPEHFVDRSKLLAEQLTNLNNVSIKILNLGEQFNCENIN